MDELSLARALHVLAVVHWIGGVTMVTVVVLPGIARMPSPTERLRAFEAIEGRFSRQARVSTLIAGFTGAFMTDRLSAWGRFLEPAFWWMHAMVLLWAVFTFVLFVAEPLFLHHWFRERAASDSEGSFRLLARLHRVLLALSLATFAAAVLGAHGALA
jgi:uncharacterized membrane protein